MRSGMHEEATCLFKLMEEQVEGLQFIYHGDEIGRVGIAFGAITGSFMS